MKNFLKDAILKRFPDSKLINHYHLELPCDRNNMDTLFHNFCYLFWISMVHDPYHIATILLY